MSVVKINAIEIPEGMGPQLEGRFAGRAKMVEQFDGFEDFQLLRPVEGETRYFVYTRWASEEAFQAWQNSQDFAKGHFGLTGAGTQAFHANSNPIDLIRIEGLFALHRGINRTDLKRANIPLATDDQQPQNKNRAMAELEHQPHPHEKQSGARQWPCPPPARQLARSTSAW